MAPNKYGYMAKIGIDTTGVQNGLTEADSAMRAFSREMREVNNVIAQGGNSAEMAAQRNQLYAEQITQLNRRLEALRSVEEDINRARANGNIDESEYRAYRREIEQTENALQNLREQQRDIGANAGKDYDKVVSALQNVEKVALATTGAVAAALGKLSSDALSAYSQYEQLVGGNETLFAGAEDIVLENAENAFKTAGVSANNYMQTVTSFSATLLQGLDGDTEKAARIADQALIDMSDNANKMGTAMGSIQYTYQGFAKQNYTMLDNLKLGYGGTQAEMQRLLQDAEKISGVHYDLGNLADMYSAIHVIQQEMDITGTTAKEATTTLTGSFSAMSAAFQNVLSSLSTGADLSAPLAALVETSKTYLVDNLLPMVGNVLAGIPEVVYSLVPQLLQSGTELVNSLASGFAEGIPEFFSNALPQLLVFTEQLRANAGSFVDAGLNLITQLLNGLIAGLPQLIAYAPDIIINLAGIINDNMPKILAEGISIVVQLAAGIIQAFPSLLANWKKIFQAILSVISAINWVSLGANILKGIGNGIKSMGSSLLEAFKGGFSSALNWIKNLPAQAVQWGKNLIKSFTNGLTGKGGAVGIGSILGTAGASIAENAKGSSKIDWAATWADARYRHSCLYKVWQRCSHCGREGQKRRQDGQ